MERTPILVGLIAILVLVSALVVATAVLGHTRKKVVRDAASSQTPAGCDIREAISKVTTGGLLRHTVTTRGRRGEFDFTVVVIAGSRSDAAGGNPDYLLNSSGGDPANYHLTNHRKTAVFTVNPSRVRGAVNNQERYFWKAVTCSFPGDEAPDEGAVRQSLRRHDHH